MLDEGNDLNLEPPAPEGSEGPELSNRTFLIVGGVFAALILLTLICFAALFFLNQNKAKGTQITQTAVALSNAQQFEHMTATAQATLWTSTPLPSPLPTETNTPLPVQPSSTPVVAQPTDTPIISDFGLTATLSSLQTQVAANNLALTVTLQATRIPNTGFADEVGLPGLIIMAVAFVLVILLARRLRSRSAQ